MSQQQIVPASSSVDRASSSNFAQLSPDVMHDILCYLSVDDSSVKSFLLICKNISLNMLGIFSIDDLENKKEIVNSSQFYTTMTFLSMRKNVERFELYVQKRGKFIKRSGDFHKQKKRLQGLWESVEENRKDQLLVGQNMQSRSEHDFKKRIQTKTGEFSSSKAFYRLTRAVADLNKLFPHWLTSKTEFADMALMKTYISQTKGLNRLYKTLYNLKLVNSPVLFKGNEEDQLEYSINTKLNSILFDSKRFSKSVNKHRDWKLIFEKQLEKDIHFRLTESILKIHKYCRHERQRGRHSYLNKVKDTHIVFNTELTKIMQMLEKVDEKTRLTYLFEKSFAHGRNRQNGNNHYIGLLHDMLYLFIKVRKDFKTRNKKENLRKSDVMIQFILYTLKYWKIFYKSHCNNIQVTDSSIIRDFLLDGSRDKMKIIFLLGEARLIDWAQEEFKETFQEYFSSLFSILDTNAKSKSIRKLVKKHEPVRDSKKGVLLIQ